MKVRTSPVNINDKIIEANNILNGIKSKIDLARTSFDESIRELNHLSERKVGLEESINLANSNIESIFKDISDLYSLIGNQIRSFESFGDEFVTYIKIINGIIDEAEERLSKIIKLSEEEHLKIVEENKIIDRKRKDVDIYIQRLKDKYKKLDPNTPIII